MKHWQTVAIDAEGRSWALEADLLGRFEIAYVWEANLHRRLGCRSQLPGRQRADLNRLVAVHDDPANLPDPSDPDGHHQALRDRQPGLVPEFAEQFEILTRLEPFEW